MAEANRQSMLAETPSEIHAEFVKMNPKIIQIEGSRSEEAKTDDPKTDYTRNVVPKMKSENIVEALALD